MHNVEHTARNYWGMKWGQEIKILSHAVWDIQHLLEHPIMIMNYVLEP